MAIRIEQAPVLGRNDFDSRLTMVRYHQVARMMPVLYPAHAICDITVAIASRGDFPFVYQVILPALLVGVCIWQVFLWRYRAGREVDAQTARRRLRQSVGIAVGLCLAGGLWALGAQLIVTHADRLMAPVFAMVFGLSTAICFATLPRVPQILMALVLGPVTMAMILRPEHELRAIAVAVIVLCVVLVRLSHAHATGVARTMRLQTQLEQQAWFDSLTGLANRRALAREFAQSRQDAAPGDHLSLVMIDLDGFKEANDTYGHIAGDGVLVEIADRLKVIFADARLIARLGGDEFVLLFAGPARTDWPERIAAAASVLALPVANGRDTIPIAASIGHAQHQAETAHLDQMLIIADTQLYGQKAQRKSSVRRRA